MSEKQSYLDDQQDQVRQWKVKIDNLKFKASDREAEARTEYNELIAGLHLLLNSVEQRLIELKIANFESDIESFDALKRDVESAWSKLRSKFFSNLSMFK